MRTLSQSDLMTMDIVLVIYYNQNSNLMGPCMSQKQIKTATGNPLQYKQDRQLQNGVLEPLDTTLYNLLRKSNDLEIIRPTPRQAKILFKQSSPNLNDLTPSQLKMFFSFKNVLIIGPYQPTISKIKQSSNPKSVYAISQNQAVKFINKYPIFGSQSQVPQAKQLPIFAFKSNEIMNNVNKKQIFLHSQKFKNETIYSQLGINSVISDSASYSPQQLSLLLGKSAGQRTVLVHSGSRSQDELLDILSNFAIKYYGMSPLGSKIYIRRCLPQTTIEDALTTYQNIAASSKSIPDKQNQTLTQIYHRHLVSLHSEMGGNENASKLVERAYNLLVTLVSNIYNNKGQDSYRRIRKTNSQINELLGKYKYGQKLLSQVGFKDDGSGYLNSTDIKYLKIYRTDLDMAYRNFVNGK